MSTRNIGVFEAKVHLSSIIDQVRKGCTFIITRRGKPLAELRPVSTEDRRPSFGSDKGRIFISEDFNDPVPGMEEYAG
jgi:prevent-host-death family protein